MPHQGQTANPLPAIHIGYWPVLKILTDKILDDDVGDDTVYMTGQSQGGGAAALMSMCAALVYDPTSMTGP
jgi:hypothetical protein